MGDTMRIFLGKLFGKGNKLVKKIIWYLEAYTGQLFKEVYGNCCKKGTDFCGYQNMNLETKDGKMRTESMKYIRRDSFPLFLC